MPSIVINEKDETLAGVSASSTDVVFVPGFANTNGNYLIYRKSGLAPDNETRGYPAAGDATLAKISADFVEGQKYPMYACNTVDQITWKCVSAVYGANEYYEWEEQDTYIEPCPENIPTLCTSVAAFEAYFGKAPYRFTEDQDVSEYFKGDSIAKGSTYLYRAGDYEKSYIYAKELVTAGLPVIYENITSRGNKVIDGYGRDSRSYVRAKREITASVEMSVYEDIFYDEYQGPVTDEKVAQAVLVNDAIRWIIGDKDATNAITTIPNSLVYAGDSIVISAKQIDDTYGTTYRYVLPPEVLVDADQLLKYMETQATAASTVTYNEAFAFKYVDGDWHTLTFEKDANNNDEEVIGEVVNLDVYGFSVSDENRVKENDEIFVGPVHYEESYGKATPTVDYFYSALVDCYNNVDKLLDKGEYTVKYITSGAYPVYELVFKDEATGEYKDAGVTQAMIKCAYLRGDAFAIIDHSNNPERSLKATVGSGSVYAHIVKTEDNGIQNSDDMNTFATMFTPWATYSCSTAPAKHQTQLMPASFAYLTGMAQSVVTNPNWLAIAGVNRGLAPSIKALNTVERLTNTIADAYQPRDARAINAITNIKPYGLTIWGNRTLVSNGDGNLTGKSFLNIRSLICDIKKVAYTAAKSLLFEQNTEILWNKFKTQITPTLDKMVHGYGLSNYKIIKATTKYNGDPLAKGEIAAVIKIYPIYAVEDFEITVVMSDEGVEVN